MRISGSPGRAQHNFSKSPQANIPRSSFNRSHGCKTTFDAGYLVPVLVDEALPGDTFNLRMTAFARFATPIFPVMDNLYLESFFFAVPYRLVWDNWAKFNGEQRNPGDSTSFIIPQVVSPAGGFLVSTLYDYFGIPTEVPGLSVSALYGRAYNLIYNEWFRDENLQNSVVVDVDDGPDTYTDYVLLRRGKRHDYFTSCLPFPQKGPAVTLPLGTTAPVVSTNVSPLMIGANGYGLATGVPFNIATGANPNAYLGSASVNPSVTPLHFGTVTGLQTDLTAATAATINQLRQAFQIQRLYERDARGGTRYIEILKSHFGVTSPDARLQRPEYLGGGSSAVNIHPVTQTSESGVTPLGTLSAYGTVTAHGHGFTKSFVEHSIVIGMVMVRADLNYQQGLNRMWSRSTRFDFYWPALSHIGEQAVLNKEIYAQGSVAPTVDSATFGYIPRYDEYRYKPSIITGQFRSNFAQSLDAWHLAQDFASVPALNAAFIVEAPPIDRVKALDDDYPDFLFDSHFSYKCARPMPVHSVPGLIDHF